MPRRRRRARGARSDAHVHRTRCNGVGGPVAGRLRPRRDQHARRRPQPGKVGGRRAGTAGAAAGAAAGDAAVRDLRVFRAGHA
ncbi:hypothetical protein G6F40_017989 [Rhizopus arrhizus]|nr:hypothetical protein G6F40_017989 [Rhizopus arrhizus]